MEVRIMVCLENHYTATIYANSARKVAHFYLPSSTREWTSADGRMSMGVMMTAGDRGRLRGWSRLSGFQLHDKPLEVAGSGQKSPHEYIRMSM